VPHATHTLPPIPHAVVVVPVWQMPPLTQPAHESIWQAPPTQL
jgi:hypothetical protein